MVDLEALEALLVKATKGPWFVRYCDDDSFMCMTAISAVEVPPRNVDRYDERDPANMVAIVYHQVPPFVRPEDSDGSDANAALIAAAPTAIAELIAEVRRLRAIEARVEGAPVQAYGVEHGGSVVWQRGEDGK